MWPFNKKKTEFNYTDFKDELHILCKEWFHTQIHDLPEDELPPQEEIDQDILDMRDDTFQRVHPFIQSTNAISNGDPDDTANSAALTELLEKYKGHEATTPIFTKLALSKAQEPKYNSGWPLCVIRVVAETWLQQSTGA
jgi:hypothetical protein